MRNISDIRADLVDSAGGFLRRYATWKKTVKIVLILGGALAAGLGGLLGKSTDLSISGYGQALQLVGFLLVAFGGVVLELLDKDGATSIRLGFDATEVAEAGKETIRDLQQDFLWFTRLYSSAAILRKYVEATASQDANWVALVARFGLMLDVIVADAGTLFHINSDRWNFAIYWHDKDQAILECMICRRPSMAEQNAAHRSWQSGHGHVGLAFQQQKAIVARDTSEPESSAVFDPPEGMRNPDDKSRYRSIASLPITSAQGGCYGVLVATSDVMGRFFFRAAGDDSAFDPIEPLRTLADNLALAADIHYMKTMPKEDTE